MRASVRVVLAVTIVAVMTACGTQSAGTYSVPEALLPCSHGDRTVLIRTVLGIGQIIEGEEHATITISSGGTQIDVVPVSGREVVLSTVGRYTLFEDQGGEYVATCTVRVGIAGGPAP